MRDLYIGDFEPEDDGANSKGGILGNEGKDSGSGEDIMSRVFLALAVFGVIFYLYTQVA
jgi:hypothetical protein